MDTAVEAEVEVVGRCWQDEGKQKEKQEGDDCCNSEGDEGQQADTNLDAEKETKRFFTETCRVKKKERKKSAHSWR